MPRFKEMPMDPRQLMLYVRSVEDALPHTQMRIKCQCTGISWPNSASVERQKMIYAAIDRSGSWANSPAFEI